MTKSYGVGIIGAGWVAGEYVKAFRDHPLTQIVGMYNKTPEKATNLMKTHGVDGKEFKSVDALLDDKHIDIVVHCAHADTRAEYISRAALSGRHVVIEKPASTSPEGTAQIVEAVKKAGVKSIVSCVLRWNPQFQTIRALMDDGKLGDLMYAEGDYWHPIIKAYPGYPYYMKKISGGSSFTVAGVHAADTLRWLAGEIVEVAAFSAGPIMNKEYEYPPVTVASLRFANGAIGKLSSVIEGETPYIFNMRLFGTTYVDRQQPHPLFQVVSRHAGLLRVPDGQAGERRRLASSVRARDRALHGVHRERRGIARLDLRHPQDDGAVLCDRRVGSQGRPAGQGQA